MDTRAELIEKAGLLHDIGKLVQRARDVKVKHEICGRDFLAEFVPEARELLRAVSHHHADSLKGNDFSEDDITWLVYEADNQSSGADRRDDEEAVKGGFNTKKCLDNVFNRLVGTGEDSEYLLISEAEKLPYPLTGSGNHQLTAANYVPLLNVVRENFRQKNPIAMTVNELLRVLEAVMSYIPSSTKQDQFADISLYDHSKLTGAMVVNMYQYFQSQNETNYKKYCFTSATKFRREQNAYLIVAAQLSGRDDFISLASTKGSAKSLRGRSVYLEIMLEHIIDEILQSVGVSRSCLLFSGGGKFKLLLANTGTNKQLLKNAENKINHWLLLNFGLRLNFNLVTLACTPNDFLQNSELGTGVIFNKIDEMLQAKLERCYTATELTKLFDPSSEYNAHQGRRECSVCHTPSAQLVKLTADDDSEVCLNCQQMFSLGQKLADMDVMVIHRQVEESGLQLPSLDGESYCSLEFLTLAEAEANLPKYDDVDHVYLKNQFYTGSLVANYLWSADYAVRDSENHVLSFEQMARSSGGLNSNQGIVRLGMLELDVDDLQIALATGFSRQIATLSRYATLSRQLECFFRRYVNDLCQGNVNGYNEHTKEKYTLFWREKNKARNVQVICAEGGNLLIVGAWDDLLELAVDINQAFKQFTNDKLTLSAGLGLFHPKYPVAEMLKRTHELLLKAKSANKNSIALFGAMTNEHQTTLPITCFTWETFQNKVIGEKLGFIATNFNWEKVAMSNKLPLGKSSIYRMLDLLEANNAPMNLARFAYVLARMEPAKSNVLQHKCYELVRKQLYQWMKQGEDRLEILTALQLIVYHLRDKGDLN